MKFVKGILLPHERLILERAETEGDLTPRPLIVIDCENSFQLLACRYSVVGTDFRILVCRDVAVVEGMFDIQSLQQQIQ